MNPASLIAMVRPASFCFNEETALTNFFQNKDQQDNSTIQQNALTEFDAMVSLLRGNGIEVLILDDNPGPVKPDAVFPNNWFSCMDNRISVFPMCAINRRPEKRAELIKQIKNVTGVSAVKDLSSFEQENTFLEGTGSMVIDHRNRFIYACLSIRTNEDLLKKFAAENSYSTILFNAADDQGRAVYHTNVMMCIGDHFAVICTEAINKNDRSRVIQQLSLTGREIINISFLQMNSFAGNMLQLMNDQQEKLLILSRTAFRSLLPEQINSLENYARLIVPDVSFIETTAGGSVRCMMAELFC